MQNQQNLYQKSYYQSRPELKEKAKLRERKKREDAKAFQNAEKASELQKKALGDHGASRVDFIALEYILVPLIVCGVGYLLLHEMVTFYSKSDGLSLAWVKAVSLEAAVVLLASINEVSTLKRYLYKVVAILICAFSTFAMCSQHYSQAVNIRNQAKLVTSGIADMELAIQDKRTQRDELLSKNRISTGLKVEREIDILRSKLVELREEAKLVKPINASAADTLAQIGFRVILMILNIVISQRLGLILKFHGKNRKRSKTTITNFESSVPVLKFQSLKSVETPQEKQSNFFFN